MEQLPAIFGTLIPISAIVGGLAIAAFSMYLRAQARAMRHQERLAMIEKGLVPPPESDPEAFDRWTFRGDSHERHPGRARRAGIMMMGLGIGLAILISLTSGKIPVGVGVGGFLFVLGLARLIASSFDKHRPEGSSATPTTPPPPDTPRSFS